MGHAKVLKSFFCGADEFVSARDTLWEPSTYISKAGAEGQGSILAEEARAMVSGLCLVYLAGLYSVYLAGLYRGLLDERLLLKQSVSDSSHDQIKSEGKCPILHSVW